ncbi:MAG: uncharacterized protein KVP18_000797 [Porospora cf. gigantea A]|uniref:uncharacterized protein n=1 Tax=Porospora cf. gigantea A TaxID=2853593 RepID=UPI00355A402E|nr:MAG: hypothetical protein KVP18_000797 [Porospora cf. gigantea A]
MQANYVDEYEVATCVAVMGRVGFKVVVGSIEGSMLVKASHRLNIVADTLISETKDQFDAIVLTGGKRGAERLLESKHLQVLLRAQANQGRLIAAIGAPSALLHQLEIWSASVLRRPAGVVYAEGVLTASSPGEALEFALKIVELLAGDDAAKNANQRMQYEAF